MFLVEQEAAQPTEAAEVAKMIAENPSVAALLEKVLMMGEDERENTPSAQGPIPGANPAMGMQQGLGAGQMPV